MKKTEIGAADVLIRDGFWGGRIKNAVENVIPYQWRVLNDNEPGAAKSHAVANYKIAAGLEQGEFEGCIFQDSDLAKWIEGAAYSLLYKRDPKLESDLEEAIRIIGKAQRPDGYIDTYYILKEPDKRWTNIAHGHELYVTGHMLEAAVAYYQVTGRDSLLNIMEKNVDLIRSVFGHGEGKIDSYPGHEEIELALVKAYRATGKEKFLKLAEYFVENRGRVPGFQAEEGFPKEGERSKVYGADYHQAHAPIREQEDAEGHAVRAMYFFTGAAGVALETGDESLKAALERLWKRTIGRRMYITGGVGSQSDGERFTIDYDLPNDTCYTETCAAIGLAMWCLRMLRLSPESKYADVMERALYNNVLSGISQDGERYFYVNPLAVDPETARYRADHKSVEPSRVKWFGCACCPPNVTRTLCSLGTYVYTRAGSEVYQNLYIGNEAVFRTESGEAKLVCETEMPWEGRAKISCHGSAGLDLRLRIPPYAEDFRLTRGGEAITYTVKNGYAVLDRAISDGDVIEVSFQMRAQFIAANPRVAEDCGRVAVVRGPLVYCAEQVDNFRYLDTFRVSPDEPIREEKLDLFGGIVALAVQGSRLDVSAWDEDDLYRPADAASEIPCEMKLIPYFLWNNRGEGELLTWLRSNGFHRP